MGTTRLPSGSEVALPVKTSRRSLLLIGVRFDAVVGDHDNLRLERATKIQRGGQEQ